MGRNDLCSCGSGKKHKHCCGRLSIQIGQSDINKIMYEALAAQRIGDFSEAERLYSIALAKVPDIPDALHMLGAVYFEQKKYREAYQLIRRALDLTQWGIPNGIHNISFVLSAYVNACMTDDEKSQREIKRLSYQTWRAEKYETVGLGQVTVSVVIPCYNHSKYIETALTSVFQQTHRAIEIIVIDDGSSDGSPEIISEVLKKSPFPHRFIARSNRGAAPTINEGVALSTAPYINVLNSDDYFHPERFERMLPEIVGKTEWGFSNVLAVDNDGEEIDLLKHERAFALKCMVSSSRLKSSMGMSFISCNNAISTGNMLISKNFFDAIGGFNDYRYVHDWDFCLRALPYSEPIFVPSELYYYRLHGSNTISESKEKSRAEANRIIATYLKTAFSDDEQTSSPFAPNIRNWGKDFMIDVLGSGVINALPKNEIKVILDDIENVCVKQGML